MLNHSESRQRGDKLFYPDGVKIHQCLTAVGFEYRAPPVFGMVKVLPFLQFRRLPLDLVPFQLVLANLLSHAARLGGRLDGALM